MSRRSRAACCCLPCATADGSGSEFPQPFLCPCALQLKVRQLWAEVEYTVTGEVEQLDLGELINDGQIAIGVATALARHSAALAPVASLLQIVPQIPIARLHATCAVHARASRRC